MSRVGCLALCLAAWCMPVVVSGQEVNAPVETGRPLPAFSLRGVQHFAKENVTNEDFKGKWLVLDFWIKTCRACVASFPKINQLQQEFAGEVQFVLVGQNDRKYNDGIEKMYERLEGKMELKLAHVFDSVLCDQWGIMAFPHLIIVDPDGVVRAKSNSFDLTAERLRALIDGRDISLSTSAALFEIYHKTPQPSYEHTRYISEVTRWKAGNMPRFMMRIRQRPVDQIPLHVECNRVGLNKLYLFAYTGYAHVNPSINDDRMQEVFDTLYPDVVLDIRDSTLFKNNFFENVQIYTYRLKLPDAYADSARLLSIMRDDLKRSFGYHAAVEERELPVWELRADGSAAARLRACDTVYSMDYQGAAGFEAKALPANQLVHYLASWIFKSDIPFVDRTGMTGLIDIRMDALMSDVISVNKELERYGLRLVKGTRRMKAVVIRDAE